MPHKLLEKTISKASRDKESCTMDGQHTGQDSLNRMKLDERIPFWVLQDAGKNYKVDILFFVCFFLR